METLSNNDKFDIQLINALQNAELEPPVNGWEKLQLKRAEKNYKEKLKKRLLLFSLLFLCFSIFLTIMFFVITSGRQNLSNINAYRENIAIPRKANTPAIAETKNNIKDIPMANSQKYTVAKNYSFTAPVKESKNADDNNNKESITPVKNNDMIPANNDTEAPEKKTSTEKLTDTTAKPVLDRVIADTAAKKSDSANINLITNNAIFVCKVPANEIHFGAHYTFNSSWILNQNTYGNVLFKGRELAYEKTYGSAYGIMVGYDVRRKHGYQTGIVFSSVQGQKYHDVFGFGEFYREVNLKYLHIPLLYKFKWNVNKKEYPIILNFIAGLQYGRLKYAKEIINGSEKDIMDHFHKNEMGFVFNIEGDFYLNKFLYITAGINSNISNNINSKDYPVADDYGKSHNFLFGINAGLNYYIKTKEKVKDAPKVQ